jgi:hypothetical protein
MPRRSLPRLADVERCVEAHFELQFAANERCKDAKCLSASHSPQLRTCIDVVEADQYLLTRTGEKS